MKKTITLSMLTLFALAGSQNSMGQCSPPAQPSAIYVTGGAAKVCPGDTRTYYVYNVAGVTWTWTMPTGATINTGQGTRTISVTYDAGFTANGTMSVVAVNACGPSTPRTLTISRNVPATPGTITGSAVACINTSGGYSVTNVAGMTYLWTTNVASVSYSAGQGTNSVTADFDGTFTTGYLYVQASNTCATSAKRNLKITSIPSMPTSLTGAAFACAGTSGTYSVPNVAGVTWNWTSSVPTITFSAGQGTNSVTADFDGSFTTGTMYVQTVNACGSSTKRSLAIKSVPSMPGAITGPVYGQCGLTSVPYSIAAVAGATSYLWSLTGSGTITSPTNGTSVTLDFPVVAPSGMLQVTASNACGTSAIRKITIMLRPNTPGVITGNTSVCANATEAYVTSGAPSATSYSWTLPGGASISGPNNGTNVNVIWGPSTAGSLKVAASNACGAGAMRTLVVTMVPCREAGSSTEVAVNDMQLFPNPTSGDITLQFFSAENYNCELVIRDITGRVMMHENILSNAGMNIKSVDMNSFSAGVYLVSLKGQTGEQITRVVRK